jgi:hypothetical protein
MIFYTILVGFSKSGGIISRKVAELFSQRWRKKEGQARANWVERLPFLTLKQF